MALSSTPETRTQFQPSVWGEFFINCSPQPLQMSKECMRERAYQLEKDVCRLFEACTDNVADQMSLVDTLQHLSIDHLFKEQIGAALNRIHVSGLGIGSSSLHEVALRFRLLRTHGIWISSDEFTKFRCEDGCFNSEITNDPRGLLSLYNAAYLSIHGEVELDEAILFARQHLESLEELFYGSIVYRKRPPLETLKAPLADQVIRALKLPLPRTLKRVEALHYISEYAEEKTCNPSILELAKLDFNLLQHLHLRELKSVSQWWKDLYKDVELNYSRDRMVECFFWSSTIYYEEDYSRARIMFAKIYALLSLLDDTYDVHATLDECHKLTDAIRRWNDSAVSMLPEYLRKFYLRLLRSFQDFGDELQPKDRYRVVYNIEAVKVLSESYLQEAKWFHHNCKPTFKEQVKVSTVSAGGQISAVALLLGMGEEATTEAFEWAMRGTDAVTSCGEIARFMNDIASFNRGKNKNDVASSVECYMNEYNVTSEVAITEIGYLIEDAWRTANQARFDQPDILPAVQRLINLIVSMPFIYDSKKDIYTNGKDNKEMIERLFINPVPF
ncbi:unnamed protein product [Urochloa decumbens]|uniref:Uncharacterized protein n=1 Tax=Urochloa decumbens TaxID=240449 RepID=A0ABC8XLC0_9POAL